MTDDNAIKGVSRRLTAAVEAGPEDVLADAVALLREAATLYDARDRPESSALLGRLADALEPDDTNLPEEDLNRMMAPGGPVPQFPTPEALTRYLVRSVFALKASSPDWSKRYQFGWNDGLEAAMDAIREAVSLMSPALEDGP